ncbi:cob(I)yrinic acid a,c-diamide adenosyltransferase [Lysobacter sp. M15]|uniref:cob(I)yrinic acid a,c-diamide adenosyltransferase n=1 Tax=Lysobacter sp. M15 TaxID=2916837 RepID=UPI001F56EBCC|nr:cob(I)yrinic acid a,c-diamide adenosyltransferase [Lysobacter sp. M15]
MGNRLSKIYTRTGDDGTTGLGDGTRVAKDSARVTAYGTVDEANSAIGLLLASEMPADVRELLTSVQHQLFDLGGELCIPGHAAIQDEDVDRLEQQLDRYNADLPALKDFILPGGGEAAARCHMARTIVRRAERETVTLSHHDPVRPQAVRYLNRLSDLLFVLARVLARAEGLGEVLWKHERRHR